MSKTPISSYIAAFDIHYGFESTGMPGRPKPIHNEAAINAMMEFALDLEPANFVFGGDNLNMTPVSHWDEESPLKLENQRMGKDLFGFKRNVLDPIDELVGNDGQKFFHYGNHERWIYDFAAKHPGVSDMLDLDDWLDLSPRYWQVVPVGGVSNLGKVYFVHGDIAIRGGSESPAAKKLVTRYHRSIRAGHLHTFQTHTLHAALDADDRHNGTIVPCMCTRAPEFVKNNPNNWMNGFLYGYLLQDGSFYDSVALWIDNKYVINGNIYRG